MPSSPCSSAAAEAGDARRTPPPTAAVVTAGSRGTNPLGAEGTPRVPPLSRIDGYLFSSSSGSMSILSAEGSVGSLHERNLQSGGSHHYVVDCRSNGGDGSFLMDAADQRAPMSTTRTPPGRTLDAPRPHPLCHVLPVENAVAPSHGAPMMMTATAANGDSGIRIPNSSTASLADPYAASAFAAAATSARGHGSMRDAAGWLAAALGGSPISGPYSGNPFSLPLPAPPTRCSVSVVSPGTGSGTSGSHRGLPARAAGGGGTPIAAPSPPAAAVMNSHGDNRASTNTSGGGVNYPVHPHHHPCIYPQQQPHQQQTGSNSIISTYNTSAASVPSLPMPRRKGREAEVSFPEFPEAASAVTGAADGLLEPRLQVRHRASDGVAAGAGTTVVARAATHANTTIPHGAVAKTTTTTAGTITAAANMSAGGLSKGQEAYAAKDSSGHTPATLPLPHVMSQSVAERMESGLDLVPVNAENRSSTARGSSEGTFHAARVRAHRRHGNGGGSGVGSHTRSTYPSGSNTNPRTIPDAAQGYSAGLSSTAYSHFGRSDSSITSMAGTTKTEEMNYLFGSCHIPLNIVVMFNIFLTVALVAILSIFPLNTVSIRSLEHATTTLSASLATTLAESINANLFFLPLTVKGFAATWQLDRIRQAWDWDKENMPLAMQQLCEISSFVRTTPHLLYLTLASPITGYSAYCSPQYTDQFLVGRYITDNTSQHRYIINSSTFRYAEPLQVYTPVKPTTPWEFTVEFGGSDNPWHLVAIPWYETWLESLERENEPNTTRKGTSDELKETRGSPTSRMGKGPLTSLSPANWAAAGAYTSTRVEQRRMQRIPFQRTARKVGDLRLSPSVDAPYSSSSSGGGGDSGDGNEQQTPPGNSGEDGWLVATHDGVSIVTYSIPIIDYAGNLAIISGALQPEGIVSAFPDGLLSAEIGSAMVVDPETGMVMVNSWGEDTTVYFDTWNTSDPIGYKFAQSKGLYIGAINRPLMQLAVQNLGGRAGLANKPPEVMRWQVKFRYGGSEAIALASRISDMTGKLNLIVIYTVTRSEYTANIEAVRIAVIISVVVILVIIALVDLVLVYLFLQPLRGVASGLHDASQLKDGTTSVEGRISIIKEVADMQYHFKVMNNQLMRMKAFLPQGVLYPMSGWSGSDSRIDSDDERSFASESPRRAAVGAAVALNAVTAEGGGAGRDGETADSPGAGQDGVGGALMAAYEDFALPIDDDAAAPNNLLGGNGNRFAVGSGFGGRHGALHLNERVLLDEVNKFRRRYCSTIRFFMHIRETDVAVSLVDSLTAAFMTGIIPSILRHGGVIEIQRPDDVLVSFGAHSRVSMHHTRAAKCAIEAIAVVNQTTAIGPRVGCLVDVGEFYVGTCGAELRHARVAFGSQHPTGTDLIKLSKSIGSQILITQRLASVLDEHLIALPIDSILYPFSSKPTILYELRGSTKSLSSTAAENEVRAMVYHIKQAFNRMVKGDYVRALEQLVAYEAQDVQAARLAGCCRTLIARGVVRPFIRSIGRIKVSDADTMYDITDEAHGFRSDAGRLQVRRSTGRYATPPLLGSPPYVGLENNLHLLAGNATPRIIEGIQVHTMGSPAMEGLDRCLDGEDKDCTASDGAAVAGDQLPSDVGGRNGAASGHGNLVGARLGGGNTAAAADGADPAATLATAAANEDQDCGALFEMFIDDDDDDEVETIGDGGYATDATAVVAASSGVSGHRGAKSGELPVQFYDYEGNRWTRSADRLGHGAFSVVYRGLSESGNLVALKCFQLRARNVDLNAITEEVSVFANLHHENIVQYVGIYVSEFHIIEIMEFVPGGSLDTLLTSFGTLGKNSVRRYLRDILKGLQYLHATNIVHCDVKPHNVLLAMDGQCKLSDFGSAIARATTSVCKIDDVLDMRGTAGYMAPEVARGEVPTMKSDVFSLGVTILELLTGKLPWQYVAPATKTAVTKAIEVPMPSRHHFDASAESSISEEKRVEASPSKPLRENTSNDNSAEGVPGGGHARAESEDTAHALVSDYAALQSPRSKVRARCVSALPTAAGGGRESHAFNQSPSSNPLPIEKVLRNAANLISCIARDAVRPMIPSDLDDDVLDFLEMCVHPDPAQRATVEELLNHPWMM